jgi:hypothetical protein
MSDTGQDWGSFARRMNRQFMEALERNVEAQAEFVESFSRAVETSADGGTTAGAGVDVESPMAEMDTEDFEEGVRGYARAYEVWMDAARQMVERTADAAAGEDVDVSEFRNVWLDAANDAFKEVMSTTAFAAATGSTVGDALELRQEADEAAEDTLRTLGFATGADVEEVGDRLVELERRQHELENKLDRVLDAVEE